MATTPRSRLHETRLRVGRELRRRPALHRVARRLGLSSSPLGTPSQTPPLDAPPPQPIGIKLELTHRCNLLCPFCYTDSPRRTREGVVELPDERWHAIVDEAIELGVLEAVLTGGEPLLRRDLTLSLARRLADAGIAMTLTTNGWYVDDDVADALATVPGLFVNLSLDGHTPALHDGARGVRGSWERAVAALDRLLARGVRVQAVHVVTPANEAHLGDFLDAMHEFGVRDVRAAAAVPAGAAARGGHDWAIDVAAFRATIARAVACRPGLQVRLTSDGTNVINLEGGEVPGTLLVRPTGAVVIDSMRPFSFGSVDDGLGACWERIRAGWKDEPFVDWAHSAAALDRLSVVAYRDDDVPVAGTPVATPTRRVASSVPEGVPAIDGIGDAVAARAHLRALALQRRYRWADVRVSGPPGGERWAHARGQREFSRLNPTAGVVLDACAGGTAADAVAALQRRSPSVPTATLEADVLATVPELLAGGLLRPALAPPDARA